MALAQKDLVEEKKLQRIIKKLVCQSPILARGGVLHLHTELRKPQ